LPNFILYFIPGPLGARLLWAAAALQYTSIIQWLLLADPEAALATDSTRWTALHIAAQDGQEALAKVLAAGFNTTSAADNDGRLPLHLAAGNGHTATCQLLLDAAPHTVTAASTEGYLPLHCAAGNGHTATCQLLLDAAPHTVTSASTEGYLPLHCAASGGHEATCQLLLDTAPHTASTADNDGMLPLHYAATSTSGSRDEVCALLLSVAPHTATTADNQGWLPLHLAAQKGYSSTCWVLALSSPEALEMTTPDGRTALQLAVSSREGFQHLCTRCHLVLARPGFQWLGHLLRCLYVALILILVLGPLVALFAFTIWFASRSDGSPSPPPPRP
jgi:ankyrin repeat protein